MEPFCAAINALESNTPRLSWLYSAYQGLLHKSELWAVDTTGKLAAKNILLNRWIKMSAMEIILAAYLGLSLPNDRKPPALTREVQLAILNWLKVRYAGEDTICSELYAQFLQFTHRKAPYDDHDLLEAGAVWVIASERASG